MTVHAEWRSCWLGFLMAMWSNLMIMEAAKKSLGVPRPNYYSLTALYHYDREVYGWLNKERWVVLSFLIYKVLAS